MAYEPTVWKSGDTVTSAKLNKLEQGVANAGGGGSSGGVLFVTVGESNICDKSYNDIKTAIEDGILPILVIPSGDEDTLAMMYMYSNGFSENGEFYVLFAEGGSQSTSASSASDPLVYMP